MVVIDRIINAKSALKWAVHVDLSLHFSHHDGNRGIVRILVLLPVIVLVCCRIGTSSNNFNPVVLYFLEYFCQKSVAHDKVLSFLACDRDGKHNIAIFEDLIWTPIVFSWCTEHILL